MRSKHFKKSTVTIDKKKRNITTLRDACPQKNKKGGKKQPFPELAFNRNTLTWFASAFLALQKEKNPNNC